MAILPRVIPKAGGGDGVPGLVSCLKVLGKVVGGQPPREGFDKDWAGMSEILMGRGEVKWVDILVLSLSKTPYAKQRQCLTASEKPKMKRDLLPDGCCLG